MWGVEFPRPVFEMQRNSCRLRRNPICRSGPEYRRLLREASSPAELCRLARPFPEWDGHEI